MDELRVGELFTKFYGELALKAKIPDVVPLLQSPPRINQGLDE